MLTTPGESENVSEEANCNNLLLPFLTVDRLVVGLFSDCLGVWGLECIINFFAVLVTDTFLLGWDPEPPVSTSRV